MPVVDVDRDPGALTMTITSQFAATPDAVWELWSDPRQLERWWGPPTYPATFEELDLTPGGRATYFMTGPEGDTPRGYWTVRTVDAPRRLEVVDGFADNEGTPNGDLPTTTMRVEIEAATTHATTMRIHTTFPSLDAMNQMIEMGAEAGMQEALGQIDALLTC